MGVDGAPAGWVAACLYGSSVHGDRRAEWTTALRLFQTIGELSSFRERHGCAACVAIDIPIGLPDTICFRACDAEARRRLRGSTHARGRSASVFMPPARNLLNTARDPGTIPEPVAREPITHPAVKGLSAQAAGIVPKIAEVDAFVRSQRDSEQWLWECHPELSFAVLNHRTAAGQPQDLARRPRMPTEARSLAIQGRRSTARVNLVEREGGKARRPPGCLRRPQHRRAVQPGRPGRTG